MKWTPLLMFTAISLLITSAAFGQQEYVSRFDAFAGYTFLDSPVDSMVDATLRRNPLTGPQWLRLVRER
jgi:hypothetical protein